MQIAAKVLKRLWLAMQEKTREAEPHFFITGVVLTIGYLGFYYFNLLIAVPIGYENVYLRITAAVLFFLLIIRNHWPLKLKALLPIYWYALLIYIFPFFFSYMLFHNPDSNIWQLNGLIGLVALTWFVEWKGYVILCSLGIALGLIAFYFTSQSFTLPQSLIGVAGSYLAPLVYFLIFTKRREEINKQKLKAMKAVSAAIAHEMRTPLAAISASAIAIKKYLPPLFEGYEKAKAAKLKIPQIEDTDYHALQDIPETLQSVTRGAFIFIDMLLMKLKDNPVNDNLQDCSMKLCVQKALSQYPLDEEEKKLVRFNHLNDFTFKGNELLIIHVLFNLIKNALYHIKAANKGEISIWTSEGHRLNRLHFRDTGKGICADAMPYIFSKFYTNTKHGSGIGLAFCKIVMESMGGNIACRSSNNHYAEFILEFPRTN